MVEISRHSLFGKKPLIDEQYHLYMALDNISRASIHGDWRIVGTDYYEEVLKHINPEKRRKTAKEHYQKALENLNKIM
jgi:hypothetical protein